MTDGIQHFDMPRGVTFYSIRDGHLETNQKISFDTCNNQQINIETVNQHLNDGNARLIFASNDSVFCIPYEVRPSINNVLRSDAASLLAPRQQVIGVYDKKQTKFVIGLPEKPLDVFISKEDFKLYQLCNIFSECL